MSTRKCYGGPITRSDANTLSSVIGPLLEDQREHRAENVLLVDGSETLFGSVSCGASCSAPPPRLVSGGRHTRDVRVFHRCTTPTERYHDSRWRDAEQQHPTTLIQRCCDKRDRQ